jgi:hypothetical protein
MSMMRSHQSYHTYIHLYSILVLAKVGRNELGKSIKVTMSPPSVNEHTCGFSDARITILNYLQRDAHGLRPTNSYNFLVD